MRVAFVLKRELGVGEETASIPRSPAIIIARFM